MRIGQHKTNTFGRIMRINRQINTAGFEHSEHGHGGFNAAFEHHGNNAFTLQALFTQVSRQTISPLIQLLIAQLLVFFGQRQGLGSQRHLLRKQAHPVFVFGQSQIRLIPAMNTYQIF